MPLALIDPRIRDLSVKFHAERDSCLLLGYRRLEDLVRGRTGLDEHGAKLFSQAFVGPNALLVWKGLDQSERNGRGGLFTSSFIAYRNPRAHLEPNDDHRTALAEFLLLNHLFRLEAEALEPLEAQRQVADELKDENEIRALVKGLGAIDY